MTRTITLCLALLVTLAVTTVMAAELPSATSPFRWGPLAWNPRFEYSLTHSAGIQSRPGSPTTMDSETYSSPFSLDLGQRWKFRYTPTWTFYSSPDFKDTLDHHLTLDGNFRLGNWTARTEEAYS